MTNFAFLEAEWPSVYEAATKASNAVYPDPRTACFYARRALELAVQWVYKYDYSLLLPYQENLSALVHEPTFKKVAGEAVFNKARVITTLGNQAVHSNSPIKEYDSLTVVSELFHISYWMARTYARQEKPEPGLVFDPEELPRTTVPKQTVDQLQKLETSLREKDEKLSELLADKSHWMKNSNACEPKLQKQKRLQAHSQINMIIPKLRPATTLSTCCLKKLAGHWIRLRTGNLKFPACQMKAVLAL